MAQSDLRARPLYVSNASFRTRAGINVWWPVCQSANSSVLRATITDPC